MTAKTASPSKNPSAKDSVKKAQTPAEPKNAQSELVGPNEVFTLTVSKEELAKSREKVISQAQKHLKTDGFRQGKTPLKIVEQRLGEAKIMEMMVDEVLSPAYSKTLEEKTSTL